MLASMPARPEDLFAFFAARGIETETRRHAPAPTVEASRKARSESRGGHCKSLLLADKTGALWLVLCPEDRRLDVRELQKALGSGRLSFAKPETVRAVLGVEPGSVSPFALINASARGVCLVLDRALMAEDELNFHPLDNRMTTRIARPDLLRFFAACGHEPVFVTLLR
jgi:Ala-tRNA(Pro) deacylase